MANEEYSYNLILLGGTGAKCGEIFIHMCANGYFQKKKLVFYILILTKIMEMQVLCASYMKNIACVGSSI